ncbi:MAG: hypothetical protein AAF320_06895, partial [Myxococcota bacterium]
MTTRKLPTQSEKERGARLRIARSLTLYPTRAAFCEKHNFTIQTIQMWELGENAPSNRQLQRFMDVLKKEGISCSREWLLHGVGDAPVRGKPTADDSPTKLSASDQVDREAQLFVSLSARRGLEAIVVTVSDTHMQPEFAPTDRVGGYEAPSSDIDTLLGQTCLVKPNTKSPWQVGKLRKAGDYYVVTVNSPDCPPIVTKRLAGAAH